MKYQVKNAKGQILFETTEYKKAEDFLFSTPEPVEENILFQNSKTKEITHSLICVQDRKIEKIDMSDARVRRLVRQLVAQELKSLRRPVSKKKRK